MDNASALPTCPQPQQQSHRLDAIAAAGPGLLQASPEPGRITRWRILAPARVRTALAWKLTELSGPPAARAPASPASPKGPPPGQVLPPRLRADGVRAPQIAADRMPRHVAIIMDGNGRWAQQRGLPRPDASGPASLLRRARWRKTPISSTRPAIWAVLPDWPPLLIEPLLPLAMQTLWWAAGYGLLTVLFAVCAAAVWIAGRRSAAGGQAAMSSAASRRRGHSGLLFHDLLFIS